MVQRLLFIVFLLVLLFIQLPCFAYDLGIYGETWEIEELDIREIIYAQARAVDWKKVGRELDLQARQLGEHLPVVNLPEATATYTTFINPGIALTHDIASNRQIFYRRGTWVNPLHVVRPITNLLFFNPQLPAQKQLALAALETYPSQLVLVITKGNPLQLSKEIHHPVYYAFPALIKRFHIQATPTLLGVGKLGGTHADELAVSVFAKPYQLQEIKRCWYGCKESVYK